MNKLLLPTSLSAMLILTACTTAYDTKSASTVRTVANSETLEVNIDVQDKTSIYNAQRVTLELDVLKQDEGKTLYESWETYAPREQFDAKEGKLSVSDPAYTTAINPPKAPVVKKTTSAKPKPKIVTPTPEAKKETSTQDAQTNAQNTNPYMHTNPLLELETVVEPLTQEQKDAANALLPKNFVPPPPEETTPLILRLPENTPN